MPYNDPRELAKTMNPRKIKLDFSTMNDDDLLNHFVQSSGWGFSGSHKNGKFRFKGPDWDNSWNPMTRDRVIEELNERKRIDEEEGGDWFEYLNEFSDVDDDYERSYGPVDTQEKYNAYLKWVKEGN